MRSVSLTFNGRGLVADMRQHPQLPKLAGRSMRKVRYVHMASGRHLLPA